MAALADFTKRSQIPPERGAAGGEKVHLILREANLAPMGS